MTLLGGLCGAAGRGLSGQDEVVIGSPAANRGRAETEGLIGFFVNTLALRIDLSGSPTVGELLSQGEGGEPCGAVEPGPAVRAGGGDRQPPRSLNHPALFQAMFAWQNNAQSRPAGLPGGEAIGVAASAYAAAKFDLDAAVERDWKRRSPAHLVLCDRSVRAETIERRVGLPSCGCCEGMVADIRIS